MKNPYAIWNDFGFKTHILVFGTENAEEAWYLAEQFLLGQSEDEVYYTTGLSSGDGFEKLDDGYFKFPVKTYDQTPEQPAQTSLFSYSTNGDYRGTIQIVAENLACANTALVHFLDEEEMGKADPPMTAGLNQSGLANRMGIVNYFLNFAIKRDGLRVKRLVHRRRLAYR